MRIKNYVTIAILTLGTAIAANATPIVTGSIGIGGGATVDPSTSTVSFPSQGVVLSTSGDFSEVPMFYMVDLVDSFDYAPGTFANPVSLFTTFDNANLLIDTITSSSYIDDVLTVHGTGVLGLGFGDFTSNDGEFTLTTSQNGDSVSFEATTATIAATPEPASLALFGTGLLGIVGIARRKFSV